MEVEEEKGLDKGSLVVRNRDRGSREYRKISVQHAFRKTLHDRLGLQVEVTEHGIGLPATE